MKQSFRDLLVSAGLRQGVLNSVGLTAAGGLDYAANVFAGRWLVPLDYSVFITVGALLQILLPGSYVIRNLVAFYTAKIQARPEFDAEMASFVQGAWRWARQWGAIF